MHVMKMYFHTGARARSELLTPFIDKLSAILRILKKQKQFNFRASSLLLLYDGEGDTSLSGKLPKVLLKFLAD